MLFTVGNSKRVIFSVLIRKRNHKELENS